MSKLKEFIARQFKIHISENEAKASDLRHELNRLTAEYNKNLNILSKIDGVYAMVGLESNRNPYGTREVVTGRTRLQLVQLSRSLDGRI